MLLFNGIANASINPEVIKPFIGHKVTVTTDFGQGLYILTLKEVTDTEVIGVPRGFQQSIVIPLDRIECVEEMSDNFV